MNTKTRHLICLLLLLGVSAQAQMKLGIGPHRGFDKDTSTPGEFVYTINEPGAHFWSAELPLEPALDPKKNWVIAFDYFSLSGISAVSAKLKTSDGSMLQVGSRPLPIAETWQPFSIDLSSYTRELAAAQQSGKSRFHFAVKGKDGDRFRLRNLRLRAPTEQELAAISQREATRQQRENDAKNYLDYLRDWYPGAIENVRIEGETIIVSGQAPAGSRLEELPPHRVSHLPAPDPTPLQKVKNSFEVTIPRIAVNQRDRALSRWRLVDEETGAARSLARWPDDIPAARDLPKLTATNQKGLGGMVPIKDGSHEIFHLGIAHATMNVVLDAAFSLTAKPGFKPFDFEGQKYFFNPNFIGQKDRTVRHLSDQGIIVTCILLVGNHETQRFKHPEAEPRGTYAMPDLTTPDASRAYRAAIHFLAERYTRPDGEHGRISNWVMHNEIDQARTWTNMGEQPLARYLEAYTRSARIVHHTARLYDPTARVFISLTHHWTKPSLGVGAYTVREMLDLWAEINRSEGDFEWGVAYHPYPQNLRDPNAWEDKDATSSFDTPYITPRNIEVLPAYLSRPEMRFEGETPRAILLSEQGFNTPTLSEEDQKRQVAGLIYQFRKLRKFPQIEAYHLHRYQDMPDREGGLRLGIIDEHGNHKLGWDAYAAIGTPDEKEFGEIADSIIPEESAAEFSPPARPNIVLIMADDLGWSDTTPYLPEDEDFYETPAIAKLASQGTLYTNAYAASPLCSPTRASVLTGQYPGRIRLTTPACHIPTVVLNPTMPRTASLKSPLIEPETRTRFPNSYVTIAEQLKQADYATAFVGKWHLGRAPYFPAQQGFDHVIGGREHPGPPGGFFAPWPIDTIRKAPAGTHIDDQITTETIEWLKERNTDEPFFLNLWYYSVHAPFQAKPELIEKYREKAKSLPADAPRSNPVMGAMIETLDSNVGRITAALEELGLSDNTLVIFTSDNGGNEYNIVEGQTATNNAPLAFGKGNIGDGGQRVPFIMSWPGKIDPNTASEDLVSSVDLFPTILAATGQHAVPAQEIDGINLFEPVPEDRVIFCHFPHSPPATGTVAGTSIRRENWKLTRYHPNRLELFDLENDPGETRSLTKDYPKIAAELNEMISANLEETDSLVPIANPRYKPSLNGWTAAGETTLSIANQTLTVSATNNDPRFSTSELGPARGKLSLLIEMEEPIESDTPMVLYWATKNEPGIDKERSIEVPQLDAVHYRADLSLEKDLLTQLRLDPAKTAGEFHVREMRLVEWKDEAQTEGKTVRLWTFQ